MGDLQLQRGLPGIGEFQCYDKYMMECLKQAAMEVNEEEWCEPLPLFPAWTDLLGVFSSKGKRPLTKSWKAA